MRSGDVAARFGGEEFAAFLLDADYAQAMVAAERVRRAVEQHSFSALTPNTEQAETFDVTISIGVACYPDDGKDPIQLIEMADSALYRAKRNGRNEIGAYRPSLAVMEKRLAGADGSSPLQPRLLCNESRNLTCNGSEALPGPALIFSAELVGRDSGPVAVIICG